MTTQSILGLWAGLFGASIGSFLVVLGERSFKKISVNGRSQCICGRQLQWYENIPVASFLALKGKSMCCKTSIPVHYLLLEIFLALAWTTALSAPLTTFESASLIAITTALVPTTAYLLAKQRENGSNTQGI